MRLSYTKDEVVVRELAYSEKAALKRRYVWEHAGVDICQQQVCTSKEYVENQM